MDELTERRVLYISTFTHVVVVGVVVGTLAAGFGVVHAVTEEAFLRENAGVESCEVLMVDEWVLIILFMVGWLWNLGEVLRVFKLRDTLHYKHELYVCMRLVIMCC